MKGKGGLFGLMLAGVAAVLAGLGLLVKEKPEKGEEKTPEPGPGTAKSEPQEPQPARRGDSEIRPGKLGRPRSQDPSWRAGQLAARRAIAKGLNSEDGLALCTSSHKGEKLFMEAWNRTYELNWREKDARREGDSGTGTDGTGTDGNA